MTNYAEKFLKANIFYSKESRSFLDKI